MMKLTKYHNFTNYEIIAEAERELLSNYSESLQEIVNRGVSKIERIHSQITADELTELENLGW